MRKIINYEDPSGQNQRSKFSETNFEELNKAILIYKSIFTNATSYRLRSFIEENIHNYSIYRIDITIHT